MFPTTDLPLHPQDLGLILSYKCQSACKHCLYNCGPAWKDWMEPEEVILALHSISDLELDVQVHLTGGEPFLNYPLLLQAVEIAVELGIVVYTETNAGWCVDSRLVADRFLRLQDAGLAAVLISCTPFHAETIPLKRTLLAIDTALRIFGPQRVLVYQTQWVDPLWRFGAQTPIPLEHFIEAYGLGPTGLMLWDSFGLISGGRAGFRMGYLAEQRLPSDAFSAENCYDEILRAAHSHLDLYGGYIPGFCSGLYLGDWHALPDLLSSSKEQPYPALIQTLIQAGPYGLFPEALSLGFAPSREGYAGKCHLCVDLRRFLLRTRKYPELRPVNFYSSI